VHWLASGTPEKKNAVKIMVYDQLISGLRTVASGLAVNNPHNEYLVHYQLTTNKRAFF
jgi:hypothetical protein